VAAIKVLNSPFGAVASHPIPRHRSPGIRDRLAAPFFPDEILDQLRRARRAIRTAIKVSELIHRDDVTTPPSAYVALNLLR
jgi:hypothetical protein